MTRSITAAAAALALLAGCSTTGSGALTKGDAKAGCASLAGGTIAASAIGLPSGAATLESALLIAPSAIAVAERGPTPAATITPAAMQRFRSRVSTPCFCSSLMGHSSR